MKRPLKIIISGGGTGGHIFPAIAIANALKEIAPQTEILFVGAIGKIEMEKVPAAGYKIEGLPISGFHRKLTFKNLGVIIKLLKSLLKSRRIIKQFKPDAVVGVGGYASGPLLWAATSKNIPALIQEQNSYAGVTNKLLAKRAKKICVAYQDMNRFFSEEKIVFTGNPVRKELLNQTISKKEALDFFELNQEKPTILFLGGSGGAKTINQSIINHLEQLHNSGIQIIWQTGKFYFEEAKRKADEINISSNIKIMDFITKMDFAYKAADLVVSRAGAGTISELCLVAKPCILVPSPNVAENHQYKNALALVNNQAAILIKDADANTELVNKALEIIYDHTKLAQLSDNINNMAIQDSDKKIAQEILNLVKLNYI